MFRSINLKVNYTKPEYAVAENSVPIFTWGVAEREQLAYRLKVTFMDEVLWDTGYVKSGQLSCEYNGLPLPSGALVNWELQLEDKDGNASQIGRSGFKTACFDELLGEWIESPYYSLFSTLDTSKNFVEGC